MLRKTLCLAICLVAAIAPAQQKKSTAAAQKQRTRVLDVAATTPFFTKKGADAVKRVIAGADERKATEEEALAPAPQGQGSATSPSLPRSVSQTPPQAQSKSAAPTITATPVFTGRLNGISFGERGAMALFEIDGKSVVAKVGARLTADVRLVAISKTTVEIAISGRRVTLSPW